VSAVRNLALAVAAVAGLGVLGLLALVGALAGLGLPAAGGSPAGAPAVAALAPGTLALYQLAAADCPGLSWTLLAAIGTVESDNGESDAPGVHSGSNPAGAEGPMQFLPATFAAYALPVPPGGADPPSPYDPVDAVYAAARLLCAGGAGAGDAAGAVFAYNHSTAYVEEVLDLAAAYGRAYGYAYAGAGP
jgi:membrane-bound lytic murein transglycosylase B